MLVNPRLHSHQGGAGNDSLAGAVVPTSVGCSLLLDESAGERVTSEWVGSS